MPEFKGVTFELLDGVRGESGSVAVASKIVDERIPTSDIFIADISVVNPAQAGNEFRQQFLELTGAKYKPFQNANVFFEYGDAYNSLGVEKIIGVLNADYGSPSENPENIPFDIAHLRFPIEYRYSEKGTTIKADAQKNLVAALTEALKVTSIYALTNQKNKYLPLTVWHDWEAKLNASSKFYRNARIDAIATEVKQAITNSSASIRLLGLSGLGKTRLLLEIFRPHQDTDSVLVSSRVLYLNCNNYPNVAYEALFSKLVQDGTDHVVILDNCPSEIHRSLLPIAHNPRNKLFLLTTSSNPEESQHPIADVAYLIIAKNDLASVVDDLLEEELAVLGPAKIDVIKEFAQGIPLMAVLLADSLKKGEEFVGKLDDKQLLDNLLGEKGKDERWRVILRSYALFSHIGVEDELYSQLEFVALNELITSIEGKPAVILRDFEQVRQHYKRREIFEQRGRYVSMRPFPLAMYLAQEWLELCPPPQFARVMEAIGALPEPDRRHLTTALAEQLKYLGFNDRAVSILDKILGPGGPFDNAEVLNTELGSRLFRSFAEVNPVAVAANFVRQLSGLSQPQLQAIDKGRRNLIWVLEKLCFDKRTFADSSRILYSLAVAENETWVNNATGQFLQLFSVFLAGTEAGLDARWQLIGWGLAQQQDAYDELAVKAMRVGLSFNQFTRMNGAETQGTKILQDYQPTEAEIETYWTRIIARLAAFITEQSPYTKTASDILLSSLRGLCRAGQLQLLMPTLLQLATQRHLGGPDAAKAVSYALRFEKNKLSFAEQESLEQLREILADEANDFQSRYANLQYSNALLEERYSGDKHRQLMLALADEFIEQRLVWEEQLPGLYQQRQPYTYYFGKRLYQLIQADASSVKRFVALSLQVLRDIDAAARDQSLLAGFMEEATSELKTSFYEQLLADERLRCQLFYFVASDPDGYQWIASLHQLIAQGHCQVQEFSVLRYGGLLEKLTDEQLLELSEQLFKYGEEGYRVVLDLYFSLAFNEARLRDLLLPLLETCVRNLGVVQVLDNQQYTYKGSQVIDWLLRDAARADFAAAVNHAIIESISWDKDYHLDNDAQRIYDLLIKIHFAAVWPELSTALLTQEEEYVTYYGLKHILGSGIGSSSHSVGVLFYGDIEAIFGWCQTHQPLAPVRLAELTPIFDGQEDTAPSYALPLPDETDIKIERRIPLLSAWHPVTQRLLDEYGNLPEVLSALEANMNSYSWTGSIVPLLRGQQRLFTALQGHQLPAVVTWASRNLSRLDILIKQEKNRDAEMYL